MKISCFIGVSAIVSCTILLGGCGDDGASLDEGADPDEAFLQRVRQDAVTASDPERPTGIIQPGNRVARIELETDDLQMGVVPYDQISTREMKIHNRGDSDLEISKITTTCMCTVGEMKDRVVPPGEFRILEVSVDPDRIPGFFAMRTLTLSTNDPTNPSPRINVTTHVEAEAEFSPTGFTLGALPRGKGAEMVTQVRQIHETPLEISSVAFSKEAPHLTVDFREVPERNWRTPGKREYLITAKLLPSAPPGEYREVIQVRSNLEYQPNVALLIHGTVKE